MGSLPNLHELDKEKLGSPVFKPAPIGCLGPIRLPPLPPHTHKRGKRTSGSSRENDAMYILAPSYAMLGCCVSSSFLARTSHVNWCATSMALVCCVSPEDPDETRRECLLRRLNRGIKLAEDIGLAIGCLIATILISLMGLIPSSSTVYSDMGEVCGAEYCSGEMYFYNESLPTITSDASTVLVSIWLGLAILGFFISCAFLDYRMQKSLKHDCKCVKDILKSVKCAFQDPKLQLAAPLTFFIGLEQGFIYDDFMEAYVGCTLGGARTVAVCFLTLAFLQAVATVTLSMLLRHVADKRYFVVAVGFAFHFVLLLLLLVWKPTRDDPAVFYVISAAWGLCNSIWETLIYTLVMGLYPNSWQGPLSTSLFWRWLGLTLALGLHGVVCTRYRVIGLGTMLVMTVVPHLWLEICLARRGTTLAPL
ncbi:UNC93-like protein [Pseudomyrmex gracilis]|uniref:UNC93-like protein n=1 Tax=Pseudomyrmex gracilis TaxID=219809 RepID=UPI0009956174|nr:UNC93-like protein [Pseudomyrmex gracilis]